jgi:hypothetical protein
MTKKRHFPFTDLIRHKADNEWGFSDTSTEAALKKLQGESAIEAALLEIVLRLNQAIHAWSEDVCDPYDDPATPPEWAGVFPDAKLGDLYYLCNDVTAETELGIVVAKDKADHIKLQEITVRSLKGVHAYLYWGTEGHKPTIAEAAAHWARATIDEYGHQVDNAKLILQAIEEGKDISALVKMPAINLARNP